MRGDGWFSQRWSHNYYDHIIEVDAKVVAAPNLADIPQLENSSLIHSSRTIVKGVQSKCGISTQMLVTEPSFVMSWKNFYNGYM